MDSKMTGKAYTLKARFYWGNSNTGEQLGQNEKDGYSYEPLCESRSQKDRDDLIKAYQFIQSLGYYSPGVMIEGDKLSSITTKLEKTRPATIGQASRISGITPAAISLLLVYIKKRQHVRKSA